MPFKIQKSFFQSHNSLRANVKEGGDLIVELTAETKTDLKQRSYVNYETYRSLS